MIDRRQDRNTADQISEALPMKRAFGGDTAAEFLRLCAVHAQLAREALLDRYERRQSVVLLSDLNDTEANANAAVPPLSDKQHALSFLRF